MTRGLRAEFGDALGLMVDVNQGYTSGAAAAAVRHMEDTDLLWAEEPVGPEDLDSYRAISRASTVPLSGGEALGSLAAFRDFLQTGAISLLQPDMAVCGGLSGIQRVADVAEGSGRIALDERSKSHLRSRRSFEENFPWASEPVIRQSIDEVKLNGYFLGENTVAPGVTGRRRKGTPLPRSSESRLPLMDDRPGRSVLEEAVQKFRQPHAGFAHATHGLQQAERLHRIPAVNADLHQVSLPQVRAHEA
jgi:hypothetical protein